MRKRLRLANDRAPHRDALALAAGELRGPPVEELRQPEELGDLLDAARHLGLRRSPDLEPVAEVLANAHVRVERIALEDHRDVSVPRARGP
jgi:hypothetical protein